MLHKLHLPFYKLCLLCVLDSNKPVDALISVRSKEPYRNEKQSVLNLGSGICDADVRGSNVEEKALSCVSIGCDSIEGIRCSSP